MHVFTWRLFLFVDLAAHLSKDFGSNGKYE